MWGARGKKNRRKWGRKRAGASGEHKKKTRRGDRDPERDHETMPGNCQWELLAGGGNPRIMPVGGYMVKAKQKSKLSTLPFAELWDSPWHRSLLQLGRQMCTPPPTASLKQTIWKAKYVYLPDRESTIEAWSLTQRLRGKGQEDGMEWSGQRTGCGGFQGLDIGITAEKRNGYPSNGCPYRMGVLCFLTKPNHRAGMADACLALWVLETHGRKQMLWLK